MDERKQVEDVQDEIALFERKKEEGSAFLHNMEPSKEEVICVSLYNHIPDYLCRLSVQ